MEGTLLGLAVESAYASLDDVVRGLVAMASLQSQQKPELQQLASAFSVATEENRVLVNARIPYELIEAMQPKQAPVTEAKVAEEPEDR